MKSDITYGTHNSLTYAKLVWWQRPFAWLINSFCRCQDKDYKEQWRRNITVFDFQIAKYRGKWKASHGIAWYDAGDIIKILDWLNSHAQVAGEYLYIAIGIDERLFQFSKTREKLYNELMKDVSIFQNLFPSLIFYKVYNESQEYNPRQIYFFERYWSLAWAKEKIKKEKGLLRWLLMLPIPRLWSFFYRIEWEEQRNDRNFKSFITDFTVL